MNDPDSPMPIQHILVIDDDVLSREFLADAVKSLGFRALEASDGKSGLERARRDHPDLVLTDLRMPGMDGIELVEALAEQCPGLPVVVVTAHGSVESAVKAMHAGAQDFLLKPCSPDSIEVVIARVAHRVRLERENRYLRDELGGHSGTLIADSVAMHETLQAAERIARSKGTVLITGESGTGKERVAQFIHDNSPRRDGPFIRVNCAALSENLLESELFGHERGAFTDAHKTQKKGRHGAGRRRHGVPARRDRRDWGRRCRPSCCACSKKKSSSAWAAPAR